MTFKEYFEEEIRLYYDFYFINRAVRFLNREIRVDQIGANKYIYDIRNRDDAYKYIIDWNNYIDKINEEIKGEFPPLDFYKIMIENNLTD